MSEPEAEITYRVVVNQEAQYSIWPADKANAQGWQDAGFSGTKADALAFINEHWTDMRPLSLRQAMERDQQPAAVGAGAASGAAETKGKRGWFGRQHEDAAPPAPEPVPAVAEEAKPKRGWFGRR